MRALIFAAGEIRNYRRIRELIQPRADDLVICADGGGAHAIALGLRPHLLLGDFDSLPPDLQAQLAALGAGVEQVPVEKDQTDTHLAVAAALARGATELVLAGGIGSRLDHTLANVLLLPELPVPATLLNEQNVVRVLGPGASLTLAGRPGETFSLLPLTPAVTGVEAEGCRWPLQGARLTWGSTLGVSNRLGPDGAARIQVHGSGWLLVMQAWD